MSSRASDRRFNSRSSGCREPYRVSLRPHCWPDRVSSDCCVRRDRAYGVRDAGVGVSRPGGREHAAPSAAGRCRGRGRHRETLLAPRHDRNPRQAAAGQTLGCRRLYEAATVRFRRRGPGRCGSQRGTRSTRLAACGSAQPHAPGRSSKRRGRSAPLFSGSSALSVPPLACRTLCRQPLGLDFPSPTRPSMKPRTLVSESSAFAVRRRASGRTGFRSVNSVRGGTSRSYHQRTARL